MNINKNMNVEKLNTLPYKFKKELELEYTKEALIKRNMAKREVEVMFYKKPNKKKIKK